MKIEYPLRILEKEKRKLEKSIKQKDLLKKDLQEAGMELRKVSQLNQAIKCLRQKQKVAVK